MHSIALPLLALYLLAADDMSPPKFPLGKVTTYFTGPLDKDGYVDYERALNDELSKGIVPEKNANVLLWQAMGPLPQGGQRMPDEYFRRLGMAESPLHADYFISLNVFCKERLHLDKSQSDALNGQLSRAAKRPWSAKDLAQIATWLETNRKPLGLVVEATKRPDYYNPLICRRNKEGRDLLLTASMPNVQSCREMASALAARAMLHTGEGNFDAAWQDLIACHRLGRLVAHGGVLIESLVGMAIDATAMEANLAYIDAAALTADQSRQCLDALRALAPIPPAADKVDLAERVFFLDAVRFVHRGRIAGLAGSKDTPLGNLDEQTLNAMSKIDWSPALRAGNQLYGKIAAAMRLEDRADRRRAFAALDQEAKQRKESAPDVAQVKGARQFDKAIGSTLIDLLTPGFEQMQNAHDRTEQMHQHLYIAFVLAAFHHDTGRYPERLADLTPKYAAALPNDLFSGRPLIYRPSENGYLLYSVGINGVDEGGGPPDRYVPGGNISVRIPLSKLRPINTPPPAIPMRQVG